MNSLIVAATATGAVAFITRTTAPIGVQLFVCVTALIIVGVEIFRYGDADDDVR
jgi:hypothetical protein